MQSGKVMRFASPFEDKQSFLNGMTAVFVALPLLYLVYLQFTANMARMEVREILLGDMNASLNLVMYFSCVYGGYVIFQMKKNLECRENILAFYILLLSQVLAKLPITVMIMCVYIFQFGGIRKIVPDLKKSVWKKSYKALFPAVGVLIISTIILVLRIKLLF